MSGRAGRRGKDDRGIVIQMLDEKMDPQVAKGELFAVYATGEISPVPNSPVRTFLLLAESLQCVDN